MGMTKTDAGLLGGIATLQTHGVEMCPCCGRPVPSRYYSEIGTKGGATTVVRYGRAHMRSLARRAGGRPKPPLGDPAEWAEACRDDKPRGCRITNGEGDLTSRPPQEV